ncbi:Hsp20/alpha crystallin family protein [Caenispirillum bisanense]|uniref:Hsp20/alpha crystallin family protein n=1 Tax=Caenispirillum bisanense TaxID=414052 RepID=UPI0031D9FB45
MLDLRSLVPWAGRHAAPVARDADPVTAMRRDMERLFEETFGRMTAGTATTMVVPRMDVQETPTHLMVTMELPGVAENDVTIEVAGDLLTIKGEKKEEHETSDEGRHLVERSYGGFARTVRLPYVTKAAEAEATFDKGVLTIRLPKPAEAQAEPTRIAIKAAAPSQATEPVAPMSADAVAQDAPEKAA